MKNENFYEKYTHTVQYYETDRMGLTHHSNYVRWMEEARIHFMDGLGWSYQKFEEEGLISPVTAIECKFKHSTTFPDKVYIDVAVEEIRGVRLKLKYTMKNESGALICKARSEHGFVGSDGRIVRLNQEYPEFYQLLCSLAESSKI